jgi:hypothetical protein
MGIFDYIRLQQPWLQTLHEFCDRSQFDSNGRPLQTKSLDCNLDEYEVLPDGTMTRNGEEFTPGDGAYRVYTFCDMCPRIVLGIGQTTGGSCWFECTLTCKRGKVVSVKKLPDQPHGPCRRYVGYPQMPEKKE